MTDLQLGLKVVSTLAILVPITSNLIKMKTAGLLGRLFFVFLVIGFTTDLSHWYLYYNSTEGISTHAFNIYSLCEALWFFWLIQYLTQSSILKTVSKNIFYYTFPFWLAGYFIYPFFIEEPTERSIPFITSYEVIASFLSGFALLYLAEDEDNLFKNASFWFFLGIFFYCFCTFFIMSLLGSYLSLNLWPLNNIINIITYILYSVGLWKYRKLGGFKP